jgi:hypothetical protein
VLVGYSARAELMTEPRRSLIELGSRRAGPGSLTPGVIAVVAGTKQRSSTLPPEQTEERGDEKHDTAPSSFDEQ